MRCTNMRIIDFILIITIFMSISCYVVGQEKTLKSETRNERRSSNYSTKDCQFLTEFVQDNNISYYLTSCKNDVTTVGNVKINEESVLQYACYLVKKILSFICENRVIVPKENSYFVVDKLNSICPFNISFLSKFKIPYDTNLEIERILSNTSLCSDVCSDVFENRNQCVLLKKVSKYLETYYEPKVSPSRNQEEAEKALPAELELPINTSQKTNNTKYVDEGKQIKEQLLSSGKSETTSETKTDNFQEKQQHVEQENHNKTKAEEKNVPKTMANSTFKAETKSAEKSEVIKTDPNLSLENDDGLDGELNDEIQPPLMTGISKTSEDAPEEENKIPSEDNQGSLQDGKFSEKSEIYSGEGFFQAEESHFFFYFLMFSSVIIIGYLAFHNKNKILAYALEGSSGRRSRRRPNPARYRKLESNLEEAISSNSSNAASSSVVY